MGPSRARGSSSCHRVLSDSFGGCANLGARVVRGPIAVGQQVISFRCGRVTAKLQAGITDSKPGPPTPGRASLTSRKSMRTFLRLRARRIHLAQVAELVDALVSGTSGAIRGGSSPLLGTIS